jgi:tetratricopeptide (TPR) repeat protein
MKKSVLFFLIYIIGVSPVFAQTYQELSDRAIACTEQDSLAQAENYIRQALKLEPANPHNALLFSNLGTIQRRQRDYDQALESYTYALNIAPRAVPILLNRAALNLEMGRNEQARVDYSLVLDLEKDNREALLMRAYIYVTQRDLKFARADYERLLKLDPQNYNARLGLATLEQKDGNLQKALEILNKMLVEDSQDAALYMRNRYRFPLIRTRNWWIIWTRPDWAPSPPARIFSARCWNVNTSVIRVNMSSRPLKGFFCMKRYAV